MRHIPDETRVELRKALKHVEAASRHWRRCLMVQLDGLGRFDERVASLAQDNYREATEGVGEITADTVPEVGLFSSGYAQEAGREA